MRTKKNYHQIVCIISSFVGFQEAHQYSSHQVMLFRLDAGVVLTFSTLLLPLMKLLMHSVKQTILYSLK